MTSQKSLTKRTVKGNLFFQRDQWELPGQITQSGSVLPLQQNDWWNVQKLRQHPYYVLSMILKGGSGFFRSGNKFLCQLEYGHFLLIPPKMKHLYGAGKGDNWNEISVGFTGPMFNLHREYGLFDTKQPVWHLEEPEPAIQRLHVFLEASHPTSKTGIACEAAYFLAFLLEILEHAAPVQKNTPASDWLTKACVMLTGDLSHGVDMHQIAGNLGMSYSTFRQNFTRRTGMPPSRYRNNQRIKMACELLENTNKPHQEIAFYLGYSSEQHFSAHFKESMKISPRAYRQKKRKI